MYTTFTSYKINNILRRQFDTAYIWLEKNVCRNIVEDDEDDEQEAEERQKNNGNATHTSQAFGSFPQQLIFVSIKVN